MQRVRFFVLLLIFFSGAGARAFVFYQLPNGTFLKWNTSAPGISTNAVNPLTKAIRYYIASDAWSEANRDAEINAVRSCFDQWQSIPGANLKFEFAGLISPENLDAANDGKNIVFWAKKSLRVNGGTENISGRRAWTKVSFGSDGSIVDSDIVLNGIEYRWFTDYRDTANQAQFVEAAVLHEISHFVGLDHSPAGGATVHDGANGINTDAGLSADELAAARFFYSRQTYASIQGTVRMNGTGILGAVVVAEDAAGNIAGATVSQASGHYAIYGLRAGTYSVRVSPLDPAGSGDSSLMRGDEVAVDYPNAVTGFLPTGNTAVTIATAETRTQDFAVASGNPLRIISLSKPSPLASLITATRYAFSVTQGQSGLFVGVSSPGIAPGAELSISGDGLSVGATTFLENGLYQGVHVLRVPLSVSSNATPGLRSFTIFQNGQFAYANGYLEIAPAIPDDNFDGLDDRFQRTYWPLWTAPVAAPAADPDNDGFSNSFEYRTGTNPADSGSHRLEISSAVLNGNSVQLTWPSDLAAGYQVLTAETLEGGSWQNAGQPVIATAPFSSATLPLSGNARFYRLELLH